MVKMVHFVYLTLKKLNQEKPCKHVILSMEANDRSYQEWECRISSRAGGAQDFCYVSCRTMNFKLCTCIRRGGGGYMQTEMCRKELVGLSGSQNPIRNS